MTSSGVGLEHSGKEGIIIFLPRSKLIEDKLELSKFREVTFFHRNLQTEDKNSHRVRHSESETDQNNAETIDKI